MQSALTFALLATLLVATTTACRRGPSPSSDHECRPSNVCDRVGRCTPADRLDEIGSTSESTDAGDASESRNVGNRPATRRLETDSAKVHTTCNINGRRCETGPLTADGSCVAAFDRDCRDARWACELEGRCTAGDGEFAGVCVAADDSDCRDSFYCRRYGRCTAGDDGRCRVGGDEDCRYSKLCEVLDHCSEVDGACTLPMEERRRLLERELPSEGTSIVVWRGRKTTNHSNPRGNKLVETELEALGAESKDTGMHLALKNDSGDEKGEAGVGIGELGTGHESEDDAATDTNGGRSLSELSGNPDARTGSSENGDESTDADNGSNGGENSKEADYPPVPTNFQRERHRPKVTHCVARTNCADTTDCIRRALVSPECDATTCDKSYGCVLFGQCTYHSNHSSSACEVASSASCRESRVCESFHRCVAESEGCRFSDERTKFAALESRLRSGRDGHSGRSAILRHYGLSGVRSKLDPRQGFENPSLNHLETLAYCRARSGTLPKASDESGSSWPECQEPDT